METFLVENFENLRDNPLLAVILGMVLFKKYIVNGFLKRWIRHLDTVEKCQRLQVIELGRLRKYLVTGHDDKSDILGSFDEHYKL